MFLLPKNLSLHLLVGMFVCHMHIYIYICPAQFNLHDP